jgi:hypothetical protein
MMAGLLLQMLALLQEGLRSNQPRKRPLTMLVLPQREPQTLMEALPLSLPVLRVPLLQPQQHQIVHSNE